MPPDGPIVLERVTPKHQPVALPRLGHQPTTVLELTLLRGISMLAIIWMHVTASFLLAQDYVGTPGYIFFYAFTNQVAHFAVPAFIFASGLALLNRYPSWERFSVGSYARRRSRRIIAPYVIWTVIYYLVVLGPGLLKGNTPVPGRVLVDIARNLTIESSYYHLYFFALIIQFYLLFPVLLLLWSNRPEQMKWWVIGAFVAQLLLSTYVFYWHFSPGGGFWGQVGAFQDRLLPFYMFYFVLGMYFASKLPVIRNRSLLPIPSLLLAGAAAVTLTIELVQFVVVQRLPIDRLVLSTGPGILVYASVSMLPLWSICAFLSRRAGRLTAALSRFGDQAYGVFLVHPLILLVARITLNRVDVGLPRTFQGLVLFAVVVPISYAVSVALKRAKMTGILV